MKNKRYTVFIYLDEYANTLIKTKDFYNENDAIKYANKMLEKYARVEIIDNLDEEKIY